MGSKKKTTETMMEWSRVPDDVPWFRTVRSRAQELASDGDHSFTYNDRDAITKNYSRAQIIHMYETAYSELAESFHGVMDRNKELDQDLAAALRNEKSNHDSLLSANNRIAKLDRRVEGFLKMLEVSSGY